MKFAGVGKGEKITVAKKSSLYSIVHAQHLYAASSTWHAALSLQDCGAAGLDLGTWLTLANEECASRSDPKTCGRK